MMPPESTEVVIRPYGPQDREAIRRINYETSFLQQPRLFCDDEEVVADVLTRYYTDFEPRSCFVAEAGGKVVGYIIGTLDLLKMRRTYALKIIFPLMGKSFFRGLFFKRKTWQFVFNYFLSYLKGEFKTPDTIKEYPSTFHINVDENFRGQKVGGRLIQRALVLLKEEHVPGVQFSTMSDLPTNFFLSMGFKLLYSSRRSFLRYALGHDTPFNLFGMKF